VAASLVIAILAATGGTVYAAQDSLPDSPLYRVKLASEDVRLWLVFDDLDKATMLLDQADERAEEIKALLERDKSVGGNVLSALRNRTERASRIIENRPQETTLRLRLLDQSETQENLLLALWDSVPESGQDELAEAVALLHSTRLENTGAMASIEPGFLAGGVLDISGLVQHETGSIWTVGGVEIRVDERTIGRRNLREDQTARFLVARSLSGRLHALDITEIDPAQPPLNALVSGAVEEVEEDQIRVAGQWINISDDTLFKLKVQEGLRVKMVVNTGVSGAVASEIDLADISSAAADAPVLTYEGAIEGEVATDGEINEWSIGGRTFVITPATVVDARAGDVAAGSRAYVEAANKDGHLEAQRVTIVARDVGAEEVHMTGVFVESLDGRWSISGILIQPEQGAEAPDPGSLVALEAERQGQVYVSRGTTVIKPADVEDLVLIQGAASQTDDSTWIIGIVEVGIPSGAVISGETVEGARAIVWASEREDGRLLANFVRFLDDEALEITGQEN
jgi:hypothetical protein